tara:strand:- start:90 stop:401 length:312 start_codon:yes stop_codon:yes gene_type:complete
MTHLHRHTKHIQLYGALEFHDSNFPVGSTLIYRGDLYIVRKWIEPEQLTAGHERAECLVFAPEINGPEIGNQWVDATLTIAEHLKQCYPVAQIIVLPSLAQHS